MQRTGKTGKLDNIHDRKEHDFRYAIDSIKIHNKQGWLLEASFKKGINKIIGWYLKNCSWLEEIVSRECKNYYEKMYFNQ